MALINLREALMAGRRLPYDAEVEYLEGTGTQYIYTGVVPTSDLAYQIVASVQTYANSRVVAGGRGSTSSANQRILQYTQNNVRQLCLQRGDSAIRLAIPYDSNFHVFFSSDTTLRIDDTETASNAASDSGEESFFALFCNSIAGVAQSFSSCRISSAKLWSGGTLVRDYIPVRKGTVGAMYDRRGVGGMNSDGSPRNDGMYFNRGTGNFVLGPDVVPVEYIESHGTEYIDTGYVPTNTSGYKITYTCSQTNNSVVFGCRSGSGQRARWWTGENNGTYNGFVSNETNRTPYVFNAIRIAENNFYNNRTRKVDGNITQAIDATITDIMPAARLFNEIPGSTTTSTAMRVYLLQITSGFTSVRSLLPVRVGTDATSWEGAMMDVLTRRIYRNAGTGAFTYGNDLKYPIPAE